MDVSRRMVLTGALGAVGLGFGIGCVVVASGLLGAPEAAPTLTRAPTPLPSPSRSPGVGDLELHAWDRVVRSISTTQDATVTLVDGALPTGLAIAGGALVGRPTITGPYAFRLDVNEGPTRHRRTYAGEVAPIKRDLSVSLTLDATTPMSVTEKELDRIALLGANATLVILCFIPDATSTTFTRVAEARIQRAFRLARERGVRITLLKPHIVTESEADNFYRANYAPDSIDAFFANWGRQLQYFARLCAENDVEYLSLTCEQPGQTDAAHYDRWVPLITRLRAAYPRLKLTAAFTTLELFLLYTHWVPANTPHLARLLDVFGINSWVRLTDKVYTPDAPNIGVDDLVAGWRGAGGRTDDHLGKLEFVCEHLRLPFLITEVGVRPHVDGLAKQEGSQPPTGARNHDVQALLYRSVLRAPFQSAWCTGASIWHIHEPFAFGDPRHDTLLAGERVLMDAIARTPSFASKDF